jgi:hypothetical protein
MPPWYSTVESADNLEFSILAAIESACAISLSLYFAWYFQTFLHIIVAIGLAPLLLTRTHQSTVQAFKWFDYLQSFLERHEDDIVIIGTIVGGVIGGLLGGLIGGGDGVVLGIVVALILTVGAVAGGVSSKGELAAYGGGLAVGGVGLVFAVLIMRGGGGFLLSLSGLLVGVLAGLVLVVGLGIGLLAFTTKTLVVIYNLIRHPVRSIGAIPLNWYRIVWCTDMMHLPELFPGIELKKHHTLVSSFSRFKFLSALGEVADATLLSRCILGLVIPIVYFPVLLYRWSLKSTALFYLPFVWIIGFPKSFADLKNHFDRELVILQKSALARVQLTYAWIVVILFTALPVFIEIQLNSLSSNSSLGWKVLANSIAPFFLMIEVEAWHISRFAAALITIGLWLYIDRLLIQRHQFKEPAGETNWGINVIFHLHRLRQVLSLFTLACAAYLVYEIVPWADKFSDIDIWPG